MLQQGNGNNLSTKEAIDVSQDCPKFINVLLYINNLNQAIEFCKVHNFSDDTNLLCLNNFSRNRTNYSMLT